MKRLWMPVIGILFAALSASLTAMPAQAWDQFDGTMLEAYNTVVDTSYNCKCMPAETTEEQTAASYVASINTDAAWQRYTVFWLASPAYLQAYINQLLDIAANDEAMGYVEEAKYYRARAATTSEYSVPAVNVATQRGQNNTFLHYAQVAVSGDQVTVTPNYANVSVGSATSVNGVVNATIQVTDTASSASYSYNYVTITQLPTPPVNPPATLKDFTKSYAPTVSGSTKVGNTLSASSRSWSPKVTGKAWQWQSNGTNIAGATSSKYKVTAAELGTVITVKLTGSKSGYNSVTKTSKPTKKISLGSLAKGKVSVTGTPRVGKTLTAKTSQWTAGVVYHYQWYRNSTALTGATAKTYTLLATDKGKRIKVKAWTTKDGYKNSASRTSAMTGKIKA